ncbi:hypothetical protein QYF36_011626 [Acer negundo]|nr:hypothetical protein QYF36_011626 [Acer negundo]
MITILLLLLLLLLLFHRSEANLIKDIVGNISRKLTNLLPSVVGEQLFGIESRVEEIYKLLELDLDDRVTFVGICGMGGIGKTTIARAVYERLLNKYEGSCFLANGTPSVEAIILNSDRHREEITHLKLTVMSIPDRLYDVHIDCGFGNHVFCCSDFKGGDHLWLAYFSKNTLYRNEDGEYNCGKGVTARFDTRGYKSDNLVRRCGIHPVYKQDVEYLEELTARDGAITMPSTLQGSRFRNCIHCIKKEINANYSEDSSMEEGDIRTAKSDIRNPIYNIYIANQSEIQKADA